MTQASVVVFYLVLGNFPSIGTRSKHFLPANLLSIDTAAK